MSREMARRLSRNAALVIALALLGLFGWLSPEFFLSQRNLLNILRQVSVEAIVAFGLTLTLIVRGIDLSIGSVLGFAAALTMGLQPYGVPVACATALLMGALIGALNGFLITRLNLLPFIATLGSMMLVRGFSLLYSTEPIGGQVAWFTIFGDGSIGFLPTPVLILAVLTLVFHIMLTETRFGRNLYATGGNEQAAHLAGIDIDRHKFTAYILSGTMAALAGILLASRLNSSSPNIGVGIELQIIAAAILGGASLLGGMGSAVGTLLGVLVLGVLANGMDLLAVATYHQIIITGMVLLVVVMVDGWVYAARTAG